MAVWCYFQLSAVSDARLKLPSTSSSMKPSSLVADLRNVVVDDDDDDEVRDLMNNDAKVVNHEKDHSGRIPYWH